MTVTAKRLTETDELFMDAYQAICLLRNNLESLPQNKTPENRMNLNKIMDEMMSNLIGLRDFDR